MGCGLWGDHKVSLSHRMPPQWHGSVRHDLLPPAVEVHAAGAGLAFSACGCSTCTRCGRSEMRVWVRGCAMGTARLVRGGGDHKVSLSHVCAARPAPACSGGACRRNWTRGFRLRLQYMYTLWPQRDAGLGTRLCHGHCQAGASEGCCVNFGDHNLKVSLSHVCAARPAPACSGGACRRNCQWTRVFCLWLQYMYRLWCTGCGLAWCDCGVPVGNLKGANGAKTQAQARRAKQGTP